jgi:hypothetical protein
MSGESLLIGASVEDKRRLAAPHSAHPSVGSLCAADEELLAYIDRFQVDIAKAFLHPSKKSDT